MITTLIGLKKEMSTRFNQLGHQIPVTIIKIEPNIVVTKKGNSKILIGFGQKKTVKKTQNAYVSAIGFVPKVIKEITIDPSQSSSTNIGDKISVSIFEPGDQLKISGVTKGKGFTGVVKRWGFAGGPKTHGQSDRHRAPGSIGQTTTPGRVYKGKKMAGHTGVKNITVTNLEVIDVNDQNNLISVKGAVPGAKNGLLIIEKTGKVKNHISLKSQEVQSKKDEGQDKPDEKEPKTQEPQSTPNSQNTMKSQNRKEQ